MTMQRMQSLQVLMQREQHLCDLAQSALQRAGEAARQACEQRDELLAYRSEYQARWTGQFSQGGTMHILQCYRSFMQRLDQAVAMQSRQAELAELQWAQARRGLLEAERRVASVRKLLQRRAAEQAHAGRQREQKLSDEQAQRMRWHTTQNDRLLPQ
jgi:flagellar FliJ protein